MLREQPLRAKYVGPVLLSTLWDDNQTYAFDLGIPLLQPMAGTNGRKLAVVGGGHSAKHFIQEYRHLGREWDVWGINAMASYLVRKGIPASYYSIDGQPVPREDMRDVTKAVVATTVHRSVLDRFVRNVELFNFKPFRGDPGFLPGPSSAATAPTVATVFKGYEQVAFFGCEGSYDRTSHINKMENRGDYLQVMAGGKTFFTHVDLLLQSEVLAKLIDLYPNVLLDASGGLLAGMRIDKAWQVIWYSDNARTMLQVAA